MSEASLGRADILVLLVMLLFVNTAPRRIIAGRAGASKRLPGTHRHGCAGVSAVVAVVRAVLKVLAIQQGRDVMPEVVVYALGGRSLDQKRGLMKDITEAVMKNFSVPAEAVVVTLVETEKQAKMKGGVLFSEMGQR
jgi:4-oxalocrotonate tautomerase